MPVVRTHFAAPARIRPFDPKDDGFTVTHPRAASPMFGSRGTQAAWPAPSHSKTTADWRCTRDLPPHSTQLAFSLGAGGVILSYAGALRKKLWNTLSLSFPALERNVPAWAGCTGKFVFANVSGLLNVLAEAPVIRWNSSRISLLGPALKASACGVLPGAPPSSRMFFAVSLFKPRITRRGSLSISRNHLAGGNRGYF